MPEYVRGMVTPQAGTSFGSTLAHFSRNPSLTETNPARYGSGLRGAERERLQFLPGGVTDRSYFYLGDPTRVRPEPGLGQFKYRAYSENLYDWPKDPMGLWTIAKELNRAPAASKYDPARIDISQASNDLERMVKEYGYAGVANPRHDYPMAIMFDPTPVKRVRAEGGRVNYATKGAVEYEPIELPNSLKELQNWTKTHPAQLTRNSMENVFTNRISALEGEKPIAMPANLRELQDWDRISHDHALNLARKLYDSED
jgi:hypothetical protein